MRGALECRVEPHRGTHGCVGFFLFFVLIYGAHVYMNLEPVAEIKI